MSGRAGDVALNARTTCPARVVVRETVEEIADRKRRRPDTALGDDHGHRTGLRERGTVEVQGRACHGSDSSCLRGWSQRQDATPGMASTAQRLTNAGLPAPL